MTQPVRGDDVILDRSREGKLFYNAPGKRYGKRKDQLTIVPLSLNGAIPQLAIISIQNLAVPAELN